MAQWRTLTRNDLRAFDDDMTKFVLYAMEHGGTGRISNNGHCIIRNDNGQTMSVSRSASAGSRKQNVARDICRLFGDPNEASHNDPKPTPPRKQTEPAPADNGEVMRCTVKGCAEQFVTEGGRYSHIEQSHYRCREDGCSFVGRTPQSTSLHHTRTHRGVNPAKDRADRKRAEQQPEAEGGAPGATHEEAQHLLKGEGDAPEPEPTAPKVVPESPTLDANRRLMQIRELLGEDPRIGELQAQVDDLRKERDDLKAQLALIREALHLS